MDQFMWMFSLIPDSLLYWFINLILVVGLAGTFSSYFIRFIPPMLPYAGIVKTVGIILLVIGVYFKGGYATEMAWRGRVADQQAKIAAAEQLSKDTNLALSTALKEKTKAVKEVQIVLRDRIVKDAAKMDAQCKVDSEAVSILNDAAKPIKSTPSVTVKGVK